MRHMKTGRKLGRPTDHRTAMLRNLVTSLFEHGRIETTVARAKEMRSLVDRLVTNGKENTLHSRRRAARVLRTRESLINLFDTIAPGFSERNGGYTRIIRTRNRHGDNAPMAIIEFVAPGPVDSKAPVAPAAPALPETKEAFEG